MSQELSIQPEVVQELPDPGRRAYGHLCQTPDGKLWARADNGWQELTLQLAP